MRMKNGAWTVILFAVLVAWMPLSGCGPGQPAESAAADGSRAADGQPAPAESSESPASPIGTTWQWVGTVTPVERVEVGDATRYTITLDEEGGVAARFDCNSGRGTFEISENRIHFGVFAATRMACADDTQDALFMSQLEKVTTFFLRDGELFLEMPYDSGTLRFTAAR